ncbi:MAG: 3D domain-containing protein [Polyangiaceae bacterium]
MTMRAAQVVLPFVAGALFSGCFDTRGSTWMARPLPGTESEGPTLVEMPPPETAAPRASSSASSSPKGKLLGTFRNTYYNFPRDADASGAMAPLMSGTCEKIADVSRAFHDAVCVQGSGMLRTGGTVSFARRDCECAEVCPRTGQKICFEALNPKQFPWGRGAAGTPISPLHTLAVDTNLIPLGTHLYIREMDGLNINGKRHDGCFVAEDRGLRVQGQHVDIFTGDVSMTEKLNQMLPSNQGVTVYADVERCQ